MAPRLTRKDYSLIIGGVVVSILGGIVLALLFPDPSIDDVILVELVASTVTVIIILFGLYALVKTAQSWGGAVGRGLELAAIGVFIEMIIFVPHVHWHLVSEKIAIAGGDTVAAWFVHGMWWTGFFHLMTAVGFLLIGYGFYIMYRAVKPEIEAIA